VFSSVASNFLPNNARYDYFFDRSPFSNGGKLTVCVNVPQVLTLPTGQQILTPPTKFLVTMKQLAVSPDVFHIADAVKAQGTGGGTGGRTGLDCGDLATKDAVQAQLLEMFTLIEVVKPMIVVDYWSGGEWLHPLSRSITPPTGTWTKTFTNDAPPAGLYVDGWMKSKAEQPAIHPLIDGKGVRFNFNESTNTWSCSTQGIVNPVPRGCLTLSGQPQPFCD